MVNRLSNTATERGEKTMEAVQKMDKRHLSNNVVRNVDLKREVKEGIGGHRVKPHLDNWLQVCQ